MTLIYNGPIVVHAFTKRFAPTAHVSGEAAGNLPTPSVVCCFTCCSQALLTARIVCSVSQAVSKAGKAAVRSLPDAPDISNPRCATGQLVCNTFCVVLLPPFKPVQTACFLCAA